jgi:hypothetical protein
MEQTIKMVVPCDCPHCGQQIILNINQPYPTVDVLTPQELPEEIKNVIENQNDTPQEPEAA